MSVNRASEVWKEIKPFAIRDMNRMLDNKAGDSGDDLYAIILYDESAQKIKYYSFSTVGLTGALGAAESGDIIWIPAGTISGFGEETLYVPSSVETCKSYDGEPPPGWLELTYNDNSWETAREYSGNPEYSEGDISDAAPLWSQSSAATGQACFRQIFRLDIIPETVTLEFNYDDHIKVYLNGEIIGTGDFTSTHTKVTVSVDTSLFNINSDNILCVWSNNDISSPGGGFVLWKLSILESGVITVPSGVELVGLGKNSVLNYAVINNGILTNLKITGEISGTGISRLVSNPDTELFSNQISSLISSGSAPFLIESTTLVTNLNADMVDGKHASEFTAPDWDDIENKPTVFSPSTHSHVENDITDLDHDALKIYGIDVDLNGITNLQGIVYSSDLNKLVASDLIQSSSGGGEILLDDEDPRNQLLDDDGDLIYE